MKHIKRFISKLSNITKIFDTLRWILEAGYVGERGIIKRYLSSIQGSILDLGCGTGIFANMFNHEKYIGVDLNEKYIESAKQRCPNYKFMVSDATSLPFDDQYFSDCMVSGVLHHIDDSNSLKIIKEISRVLMPFGNLIIWEDTKDFSRWNFLLNLIHSLDEGQFIRNNSHYRQLLESSFVIEKEFKMRSGLMEYVAFHCKKSE
jgi:ubiquinone/menaquinone biosynthesis C-methylase UbiE